MKTQTVATALLYIGIFAGIPLAIIVVLFLLPGLTVVDPTALVILIIFTILIVTMWVFVPRPEPVTRPRRGAKEQRPAVKRAVPAPVERLEALTGEEQKRKSRSRRPLYEDDEKREPFVDVVEKSTQHPAAQPQVRRKAQSKARKKSAKKKKR